MSKEPATRHRQNSGGFTLLELLIAMSILSLILLTLFGGLRLGSASWEALERQVGRQEGMRFAREFVGRALIQARPAQVVVDGVLVGLFAGEADRLELATPLSDFVGIPGLYLLRLALVDTDEGAALVMERWLLNQQVMHGGPDYPAWTHLGRPNLYGGDRDAGEGAYGLRTLLRGLTGFELNYFGAQHGERESSWSATWSDPRRLPMLVRMRLEVDGKWWPDLVVALSGE